MFGQEKEALQACLHAGSCGQIVTALVGQEDHQKTRLTIHSDRWQWTRVLRPSLLGNQSLSVCRHSVFHDEKGEEVFHLRPDHIQVPRSFSEEAEKRARRRRHRCQRKMRNQANEVFGLEERLYDGKSNKQITTT